MNNKKRDKVSVITTFFNSEKYILESISSVNSQIITDEFDVEYILVNDGSEDNSLNIINLYFEELKNDKIDVKIVNTPYNLGSGGARKFGISQSSGNYLMFLDSDDYYINKNFLLKAYYDITKNDADLVEFGILLRHPNSYESCKLVLNQPLIITNDKLANMKLLFFDRAINFMPWTKIVRRSIVESHEYSQSRAYDDIETIPYWVYNSEKIIIMNSIEVNYRHKLKYENELKSRMEVVYAISNLFESFKYDINILKVMYERCMDDMESILEYNSDSEYFRRMSKINTMMLSYIYPDTYQNITYDV